MANSIRRVKLSMQPWKLLMHANIKWHVNVHDLVLGEKRGLKFLLIV